MGLKGNVRGQGGGGDTTWLQQYDGTNEVIQSNGKDVAVKVGEYVYNEFYETKLVASELSPNPEYNTFVIQDQPKDTTTGALVEYKGYIYAINDDSNTTFRRFNLNIKEWENWESAIALGTMLNTSIAIVESKIYVWDDTTQLMSYDIDSNVWDSTLAVAPTSSDGLVAVGTNLYARNTSVLADLFNIYDVVGDSWSTSSNYGATINGILGTDGTDVYVRLNASPYNLLRYNVELNTFTTLSSTPSTLAFSYITGDSDTLYMVYSTRLLKYDIALDVFDESLLDPSVTLRNILLSDGVVYIIDTLSIPDGFLTYDDREDVYKEQTIPPVTSATSASDLLATVAGTLQMATPVVDQVYNGFKSKVNLWDAGMEGATNGIISCQYGSVSVDANQVDITVENVDHTRSVVLIMTEDNYGDDYRGYMFDDNTLRLKSDNDPAQTIHYIINEYGKNVEMQTGEIYNYADVAGKVQDATIEALDLTKDLFFYNQDSGGLAGNVGTTFLQNATTVRTIASKYTSAGRYYSRYFALKL